MVQSMGAIDLADIVFYILAIITLASAILALEAKEIVYGALALALSLLGVAGFFILLDATFLAMFQITVYVGAIAVLIIFTVMLVRREKWVEKEGVNRVAGIFVTLLVALGMGLVVLQSNIGQRVASKEAASFTQIGVQILSLYWPVIIILSLVLSAAVIGAIALAKLDRG